MTRTLPKYRLDCVRFHTPPSSVAFSSTLQLPVGDDALGSSNCDRPVRNKPQTGAFQAKLLPYGQL